MLPYVEEPVLRLGTLEIEAFHGLVAAAALVGYGIGVRRAVAAGVARADVAVAGAWALAWGLVGSHVFDVLVNHPRGLLDDPLRLLWVFDGMSSYGGLLTGGVAMFVVLRRRGVPPGGVVRVLDAAAFAFPFSWILGRLGCALAHDHLGGPSTSWLAVRFPGGPRLDLGVIELVCLLPLAAAFALLGRRPRPTGFFFALGLATYGPLRFALDGLRTDDVRYFGWTSAQYVSAVAACVGVWLLVALLAPSRLRGKQRGVLDQR